ncbi:MAG: HD domain-containing phosphohydrolase [Anaerolineae bacterium]
MKDEDKTKEQLIDELIELRQRVAELGAAETGRQRAEEEIRQLKDFNEGIVQNMAEGIAVEDAEGCIIFVNPAGANLLGYSPEELLGQHWTAIVPPDQHPSVQAADERRMRGEADRYELQLIRKDNTRVPVLVSGSPRAEEGRFAGTLSVFTDITEHKQVEEELQQSFERLRRTFDETVNALASAIKTRNPYTAGHQRQVTQLACAIAQEMSLPEEQIEGIRVAGLIHDIGKISVPLEILSNPDELNEFEYGIIKAHPQIGYDILKAVEFPWPVAEIVLQHHERLDGSGYPQGLSGEEIMLEARILAVAEVVEAMASRQPYRAARGIENALEEISQNRGVLYDPGVVGACLKLFKQKEFKFEQETRDRDQLDWLTGGVRHPS